MSTATDTRERRLRQHATVAEATGYFGIAVMVLVLCAAYGVGAALIGLLLAGFVMLALVGGYARSASR